MVSTAYSLGRFFNYCVVLITVLNVTYCHSTRENPFQESNKFISFPHQKNDLQYQYNEYPMIVPKKRAAMLLDRLMVALHHALEDERNGNRRIGDVYGRGRFINSDRETDRHIQDISMEDLQRAWDNGHYNMIPEEPEWQIIEPKNFENKNDETRRAHNGNEKSGLARGNGRSYWRCYFNAVSCF
ncbi:hypothetical protein ACFFRR_005307 [Megaselia abdita]